MGSYGGTSEGLRTLKNTRRIAVVGIDGSGKSTVIRRLVELARSSDGGVAVMNCPLFHETPNAPLAALSRQLDAFSHASDELGSFELKAVSLFLQMTLYGPVERFFLETYRPAVLVSERHAVVDSLAYGPFYQQRVRKAPDRAELERPLRERLGPEAWESIREWCRRECRRLGQEVDFWDLAPHVTGFFRLGGEPLIAELGRQYRTELPEVVLLLDVPGETAQARIAQREGTKELHEKSELLEALRRSYHRVIESLRDRVETHVIETGSGDVEETLREVVERTGVCR